MSIFRDAIRLILGIKPRDTYDEDVAAFQDKYGPYARRTHWVPNKRRSIRVLKSTPLWREFRDQRQKERGE